MILRVIMLTILIFATGIGRAVEIEVEVIDSAKDVDDFYPAFGKVIYIRNFNVTFAEKKHVTKLNRVLKLPVATFGDRFGLKKDDVFYLADFDKMVTSEYRVKDYFYVLTFDVPYTSTVSNSSLILSDNLDEMSDLVKKRYASTGLAYRGKSRKIKSSIAIDWVPVKDVPRKDVLYSTDTFKHAKDEPLRVAKIYQHEVIVSPVVEPNKYEIGTYEYLFKQKPGFYKSIGRGALLLDNQKKNMKTFDWIEGMRIFFKSVEIDDSGKLQNEHVVLCGKDELSRIDLGANFDDFDALSL